jgi:predicted glycoside hydrolase/deacetylase ChbG (UPF0249 family)
METLAERLGYARDATLLIINCDDLGSTRAANASIYHALRRGTATTATLMVPCPWARDAARMYMGEDIGVHLTLTSEWDTYRWPPITHSPSLLDGDGGFPRTVADVWDHADIDEVRKECRAQIERAILWGFDVTHIDSHMGTSQLKAEFFDVYLEMAVEFGLPLRMAGASAERIIGFPYRKLAAEEGIVFTDHLVNSPVGARKTIEKTLFSLRPGVTEVLLHPAVDTDELRHSYPDADKRIDDDKLLRDPLFEQLLERSGVTLIGYRELRELQRRETREHA